MYVISLSNISIKTNFKQIARVELKYVQYSEGERFVQRRAILLSPQCGDTTYCIRQATFVNFKGKRT